MSLDNDVGAAALEEACADPRLLAYWLDAYGLTDIAERLECGMDAVEALWFCLTPRLPTWLRDLLTAGRSCRVGPCRLSVLVHEAIAEQTPSGTPRASDDDQLS